MSPNIPIKTDDLTESSVKVVKRVEVKLNEGVKTFRHMKLVIGALAPLVAGAFGVGLYSSSLAKKAEVAAHEAAYDQRLTATDQQLSEFRLEMALHRQEERHTHEDVQRIDTRTSHTDDMVTRLLLSLGVSPTTGIRKGRSGQQR